MTVYLLHLEQPLSKDHTAQHYIGWTDNLTRRLNKHYEGNGARFMEVAKERGISWMLVKIWTGTRKRERQLKNQKNSPRLCPVCKGQFDFEPYDDIPF
jgi:predicted GIY-YIG superfamily endonuclease